MSYEDPGYFTMQDATVRLLNHPQPEWRGEVDCAFFQLAAGASPIRVWNYMRREGPAMYEEGGQAQALEFLQEGTQSGAPPDDTALSNSSVTLQLMLNEERFQSHYYAFRSMTGIGDVEVFYEDTKGVYKQYMHEVKNEAGDVVRKEKRWGLEHRSAGYRLFNGQVGTVGREISVNDSIYPSIELQFQNMQAFWVGADGQKVSHKPLEKRNYGQRMIRRPNSLGDLTGTRYGPYSSAPDPTVYNPGIPEPDEVRPGFFIKRIKVDKNGEENKGKVFIQDVTAEGNAALKGGGTDSYFGNNTRYDWDAAWQFFPVGVSGEKITVEEHESAIDKYIENYLEHLAYGLRYKGELDRVEEQQEEGEVNIESAPPPVMLFLVPQVKKKKIQPSLDNPKLRLYAWQPVDGDSPPTYVQKPEELSTVTDNKMNTQ